MDMLYRIEDIALRYPDWYDPEFPLSKADQQYIWETLPLPEDEKNKLGYVEVSSLSGDINGTCKNEVKNELILNKNSVDLLPTGINSRTAPKEVARCLENIFRQWPSFEWHWLNIAQQYTPRAINRVIMMMIKQEIRGERTIGNFSKYFTYLIKFRKKRKGFELSVKPLKIVSKKG